MIAGVGRLADFPLIDRTKSEIDEKRSNPETGMYFVKNGGNRVGYSVKTPKGGRAKYHYHWILNQPMRISMVKIQKGYDDVTKDDEIVPEGLAVAASGHYEYGDLVFMKCPLEQYLERLLFSRQKSDRQLAAKQKEFEDSAQAVRAGLTNDMKEQLLGEMA